jgi:hypothetical protein
MPNTQVSHVNQLSARLGPLGMNIKSEKLEKILRKTRWDVDLAHTAITMIPRPKWVKKIIGY